MKITRLGWEPVLSTKLGLDPVSSCAPQTKKLHYVASAPVPPDDANDWYIMLLVINYTLFSNTKKC